MEAPATGPPTADFPPVHECPPWSALVARQAPQHDGGTSQLQGLQPREHGLRSVLSTPGRYPRELKTGVQAETCM